MSDLRTELESLIALVNQRGWVGRQQIQDDMTAILERHPAHPDDITPEDVEALRPIVDKQRRERFALAVLKSLRFARVQQIGKDVTVTETPESITNFVTRTADALIAELDKGES